MGYATCQIDDHNSTGRKSSDDTMARQRTKYSIQRGSESYSGECSSETEYVDSVTSDTMTEYSSETEEECSKETTFNHKKVGPLSSPWKQRPWSRGTEDQTQALPRAKFAKLTHEEGFEITPKTMSLLDSHPFR